MYVCVLGDIIVRGESITLGAVSVNHMDLSPFNIFQTCGLW